ncbi:hypothetical protein GCM10011513_13080 [Franconibacter daqui]|uniref:hypothetical protein n=1 Tax=Franconibacter daqui TaxID=2047724 RepID=UPI00166323E8|nr:hypothetical protein [Franconibacter daqui]GGD17029.1 hypothetical protein GCM10011513_13080 [Franconibacter daqui]
MKSSYLTKNLAFAILIINLVITILIWFFIIGTNDSLLVILAESYSIDVNTVKIVATIILGFWMVKSITSYETRIVLFAQADYLKAILEELRSQKQAKRINDLDDMKDEFKIKFN